MFLRLCLVDRTNNPEIIRQDYVQTRHLLDLRCYHGVSSTCDGSQLQSPLIPEVMSVRTRGKFITP